MLISLLLTSLLAPTTQPTPIVCFGDSITKAGYPEVLAQLLNVPVHNAGVGGNTSSQGLKRIQKDVIDYHPKIVVIFFGTNDSRVDDEKVHVPIEKYEANLATMIQMCREAGAQVILCTPPPINPEPYFNRHKKAAFDAAGGLDAVIGSYRAAMKRVGEEQKVQVIDLGSILADDKTFLSPDGVHPTKEGTATLARLVAEKVKPMLAATTQPAK
jgi:lysophospholipase L1-like esterase